MNDKIRFVILKKGSFKGNDGTLVHSFQVLDLDSKTTDDIYLTDEKAGGMGVSDAVADGTTIYEATLGGLMKRYVQSVEKTDETLSYQVR